LKKQRVALKQTSKNCLGETGMTNF